MMPAVFDGSIAGTLMSVGRIYTAGKICVGEKVIGCCVDDGTRIFAQYSGVEGGPGLYFVNPDQIVPHSVLETKEPDTDA
jgi:hypothetical protein